MRFEVLLADHASLDLEDIYSCVAEHDAPGFSILGVSRFRKERPLEAELTAGK